MIKFSILSSKQTKGLQLHFYFLLSILLISTLYPLSYTLLYAQTEPDVVRSTSSVTDVLPEQPARLSGEGPWEVSEITVKGNINVKPKVIIKSTKVKKGSVYYKDDIDKNIESILGLGSIEKVSVDITELRDKPVSRKHAGITDSAVKITYIVTEKPMIKEIIVKEAKELSKSAVTGEMSLKKKDFFDELSIREDIIKITDKYHEKGYIDAKTGYEINIDTTTDTCVLTVLVSEGKKARVSEVSITEVRAFKVKKLLKKMKNRPKKIYLPGNFENDLKEIENYYKNNGYTDFRIEDSSVTFNEDKSKVFIKIYVFEGQKYKFGETFFVGNTVYTSNELSEAVEYRRGKLYNQDRFEDSIRSIQDKYADKGYLKALVRPTTSQNVLTGELDVFFGITENEPIYVAHIDIEGHKGTKTYVFRREVVQKEGEVFSASKVRRSQEKIFNLGFIDDVRPVINPTSEPDKVDLIFDITEGKPGMLTAGAGVSSNQGLVGTISLQHLNLFGRAYRTSISWNFGARVQDYYVSWSTRWIKNKPTSFGIDVFNTRRYRPYREFLTAYTQKRTGAKLTVGPRFENDKYYLTTSYTYEKVGVHDVKEIYKDVLSEGTSVTSSVYVEFARDTRDNIWDPTRGTRMSAGLDFAGGIFQGDLNYYKPNYSFSYNKKLFSIDDYPFVFALSNRFGYVGRFGDTKEVPVFERFFLGGAETIRGYNSNGQIGPLNGGKIYDVVNIEFKFPLARERKRTIVQWAFFFDIGNSWDKFDEVSFRTGRGIRQLKSGAGFGIRFTTPAFPIRLDWGYGFNHKPGEQRSDIYFTLGSLF